jgi:hypothetical protein
MFQNLQTVYSLIKCNIFAIYLHFGDKTAIYIFIYIYIYVCVCVCVLSKNNKFPTTNCTINYILTFTNSKSIFYFYLHMFQIWNLINICKIYPSGSIIITHSNGCLLFVHFVRYRVEAAATGRSLVQSSHTNCDVLMSDIRCKNNPLQFIMCKIYTYKA